MIFPTVHLNGTSRDALLEPIMAALQAHHEVINALAQVAPNGRDYYVQGPSAYGEARREHEKRMHRLADNVHELTQLAEHLSNRGATR